MIVILKNMIETFILGSIHDYDARKNINKTKKILLIIIIIVKIKIKIMNYCFFLPIKKSKNFLTLFLTFVVLVASSLS